MVLFVSNLEFIVQLIRKNMKEEVVGKSAPNVE